MTDHRSSLWVAMAVAATTLAPLAVSAEEGVDPVGDLPTAIGAAYDLSVGVEGAVSPEQVTALQLVAHAVVAARLCEGLALDEPDATGAIAAATDAATAGLDAAAQAEHRDHLMMRYGSILALRAVEAVEDEAAFCATALETATSGEDALLVVGGN